MEDFTIARIISDTSKAIEAGFPDMRRVYQLDRSFPHASIHATDASRKRAFAIISEALGTVVRGGGRLIRHRNRTEYGFSFNGSNFEISVYEKVPRRDTGILYPKYKFARTGVLSLRVSLLGERRCVWTFPHRAQISHELSDLMDVIRELSDSDIDQVAVRERIIKMRQEQQAESKRMKESLPARRAAKREGVSIGSTFEDRAARSLEGRTPGPEISRDTNPRFCVSAKEGARLLDISRATFQRLNLRSFKIGRLTRYRISTIKHFLDQQEASGQ